MRYENKSSLEKNVYFGKILPLFIQNIVKEADVKFFFKVLAKFGDFKDNKDIKKNWNF